MVFLCALTLNLLTTTIVAPPSNASKWQMGFNLAFKGLILLHVTSCKLWHNSLKKWPLCITMHNWWW
jgi:hypothetical protein